MITLAETVDRYLPDLVKNHGSQLLPGHYQALMLFAAAGINTAE
jgi:hypothetical protein